MVGEGAFEHEGLLDGDMLVMGQPGASGSRAPGAQRISMVDMPVVLFSIRILQSMPGKRVGWQGIEGTST